MGTISSAGTGVEESWSNIVAGNSGIDDITQFDTESIPVKIAGEVKGFKPKEYIQDRKSLKIMYRNVKLGLTAAKLAMDNSGLDIESLDPVRFGSFIGSGGGGFDEGPGNKDLAPVIKAAWDEDAQTFLMPKNLVLTGSVNFIRCGCLKHCLIMFFVISQSIITLRV